jgi:hypothetical protein
MTFETPLGQERADLTLKEMKIILRRFARKRGGCSVQA